MKTTKYKRGEYAKTTHICEICGKAFQGTSLAKFCSNACRCKNQHAKRKALKFQKANIDSLVPHRKTGLEKYRDFLKNEGVNVL